jgi:hypothetical protein
MRFVTASGFPEELAGIPAEETPPDFEYLEGRVDLKALQPFQLEVQAKLLAVLPRGPLSPYPPAQGKPESPSTACVTG